MTSEAGWPPPQLAPETIPQAGKYVAREQLQEALLVLARPVEDEFGEAEPYGVNVNDTTDLQWKLSGIGYERGPEGLTTYLQPRHLRMRVRPLMSGR